MIEIKNLTKYYGKKKAVDNISFTINKGEIVGFLGPNGAGKTTTMSIITGYLSYTDGSVKIDGTEVLDDPIAIKKKIGYLPEQPPLYLDMTVDEYLDFVCELKHVKENKEAHITEILGMVGITDVRKRLIRNLSKGYKQRVGLAQALVGDPEILILDEPTVGLDPKQIIEIRNVIKKLGKTRTVILSSHILPEVSAVCERVVIINKGRIVAEDTPENLSKEKAERQQFIIRVAGEKEKIASALKETQGVASVKEISSKEPDSYDFLVESMADIDARKPVFNMLSKKSMPILMLQPNNLSLEEVFIKLTKESNENSSLRRIKKEAVKNESNT